MEMSTIVRERTDDPATRSPALDIALTQQHQLGQMSGWRAEEPAVRHLATTLVQAQTSELTVLHDMLDERGGPLEP